MQQYYHTNYEKPHPDKKEKNSLSLYNIAGMSVL